MNAITSAVRVEQIGNATLYLGDCREVLPGLTGIDAVVTDPPYGEAMGFDGDEDPRVAADLTGRAFSLLKHSCKPGSYAASFWTMRSLDILLDSVRDGLWSYSRTLAMSVPGTARPHLSWVPRLQPIVLFRNGQKENNLHDRFSVWLKAKIEESGLSSSKIAKALNVDSRLVMKWSRYRDPARCLPTERYYQALRELLGLSDDFDKEILSKRGEDRREARHYCRDLYNVDAGRKVSIHPSEKPITVTSHVVGSLSDIGQIVADPFMGSGTTGVACAKTGRMFIGIEVNQKYFDIACRRMDQAQRQADMFSDQLGDENV